MTPPERLGVSHATVLTGTVFTSYRRWGCGPPLVVFAGEDGLDRLSDDQRAALGEVFTVIVPLGRPWAAPESGTDFASWLRDVLDGLGLDRVSIAATETDGPGVRAFARLEPDRVARVVLERSPTVMAALLVQAAE